MSRSTRTLIAIILFILAGFIIINHIVAQARLNEWLLPVILLAIGLVLALYPEGEAAATHEAVAESQALSAIQPKPVLEAGGSSQPAQTTPSPEPAAPPVAEAEVREVEVEENPWPATTEPPEPVSAVEAVRELRAEVVDAGGSTQSGQPDDLTAIEGIGKKMSAALVASGIDTFTRLAQSSEDDIRAAIQAAGMRFAPSVPTWAGQAEYAAKGDWEGLKDYQSTLKSGRAT